MDSEDDGTEAGSHHSGHAQNSVHLHHWHANHAQGEAATRELESVKRGAREELTSLQVCLRRKVLEVLPCLSLCAVGNAIVLVDGATADMQTFRFCAQLSKTRYDELFCSCMLQLSSTHAVMFVLLCRGT